jgi:hypothetical protein
MCIKQTGFVLLFPCAYCARLNKECIKSKILICCNNCAHFGCYHCVKMSASDLAWKKLIEAQNSLNKQQEATLAKILHLHKQRKLLQKRAGESLQTNIKDVVCGGVGKIRRRRKLLMRGCRAFCLSGCYYQKHPP